MSAFWPIDTRQHCLYALLVRSLTVGDEGVGEAFGGVLELFFVSLQQTIREDRSRGQACLPLSAR